MPGSTTTKGTAPNHRSHIARISRNADGTVEQQAMPSTAPSMPEPPRLSAELSNPVNNNPSSSADRRGSVASRQCSTMRSASKSPNTVWVFPTSMVSSMNAFPRASQQRSQICTDVEHGRRMRQRTDGEEIDAGCGDVSRGRQGDAAAGFELAAPAAGPNQLDRRTNRVFRHVVEQHQIGAGLDRLAHLLDRVAFDFDRQVRK